MKTIAAACIALALATTAQAETPQDRCANVAAYAQGVAKMRDEGVRLKEVNEITEERAGRGWIRAYNMAATMVYQNSDLPPEDVHKAILSGCLEGIK